MKFTKIFLFILLAFFTSISSVKAEDVIGEVTVVVSHTITFNCNGGTGSTASQAIEDLTTANLNPNGCARAGYDFDSWSPNYSGVPAFSDQAPYTMGTADVTLHAIWVPVPIPITPTLISVNHNGNCQDNWLNLLWTDSVGATTYVVYRSTNGIDFSPLSPNVSDPTVAISDEGLIRGTTYYYKIAAANAGGESAGSNMKSATVSNTCTVTFNKNGGTVDASPITKTTTYGGPVGTLPTAPTWSGHTFNGWNNLQQSTGNDFFASTLVYASFTVYAKWVAILPPPPPTLISVNHNGNCQDNWLNLLWTDSVGATTYVVYRSTNGIDFSPLSPNVSDPTVAISDEGLIRGTTYYYKIAAANAGGESAGSNVKSGIVIPACTVPTVTTTAATSIVQTTATSGGNVTSDGGEIITARGVVWNLSSNPSAPTVVNHLGRTTDGTGTGTFTSNLTELTANTTYHYRAYATNSVGTSYGSNLTFTTLVTPPDLISGPITPTTATIGVPKTFFSTITNSGGSSTEVGFNYFFQTTVYPDDDPLSSIDIEDKTFSVMNDLSPTETATATVTHTFTQGAGLYYMRVCADKSASDDVGDISESNEDNNCGPDVNGGWTEITVISAPNGITTTPATSITQTTATSGGSITSDGGASITAKGVVWSTTSIPTNSNIDDFGTNEKTINGTGSANFSSNITGLTANTTYYYRAYATNSVGTGYGNELTFKTLVTPPPLVTGFSAEPSTCGNQWLNLSWDATPGATSYQISKDDGTVVEASTLLVSEDPLNGYICDATKCRGSNTGLELGSTHTYQIRASNSSGFSELSLPVVSGTVSNLCSPSVTVVPSEDICSTLDISWNASDWATTYVVYKSIDGGVSYEPIVPNVSAPTVFYQDTNLVTNQTYYYRIAAANGSTESPGSTPVYGIITTTGCELPVSTALSTGGCFVQEGNNSCNDAVLTWNVTNPIGKSVIKQSDGTITTTLVPSTSLTSGTKNFSLYQGIENTLTLLSGNKPIDSIKTTAFCVTDTTWNETEKKCLINAPDDTTFTAKPLSVFNGGNTKLEWNSRLATSCTGTNFNTLGAKSGTVSDSPTEDTTYTLRCENGTGFVIKTQTVKVTDMTIKEE